MRSNALPLLLVLLAGCVASSRAAPPEVLLGPETPPPRPRDPADPLGAVMWTMGYDLRDYDATWAWLHEEVPEGPERSRAIGAAAMLGVAELDRVELADEALRAFDDAIAGFPDDDRLPMWHAYVRFARARHEGDEAELARALDALRASAERYPEFNLFGLTLSVGGFEGASPELVDEARGAFDAVTDATSALQLRTDARSLERSRRIFDSPIAPYGIPAMFAMIGDMALRDGDLDAARYSYFLATRTNGAHRWPWRAEVERRLQEAEALRDAFAARPASEHALGSRMAGAMGVPERFVDPRFGGRIGNGSCTVCHTHLAADDAGETPAEVGWIRGTFARIPGVPNPLPVVLAISPDPDVAPGGFAVGAPIPYDASRDFFEQDEHDGTFLLPALPGEYFVVLQTSAEGRAYQGYSARELGMQWFVRVEPGVVVDMSAYPIVLTPQ